MSNPSVLDQLVERNREWLGIVNEGDPDVLKLKSSAPAHEPKILWIGCSDARVSESVVLNRLPGEIFTHRNIANQVQASDPSIVSAIHFAVRTLGVEDVIVVGHTHCGGVGACMVKEDETKTMAETERERDPWAPPINWPPPPPLDAWLVPIRQRAEQIRPSSALDLVIDNVKQQVANVLDTIVVPKGKVVGVHGWLYQLEDGRVRDLACSGCREGLGLSE